MNELSNKKESSLPPEPNWMKEPWAVDHKLQRFFPRPYSSKEQLRWFITHIFGPSKKHKKLTTFIPRKIELNKITPQFKIGFVGDIMKMFGYDLEFDESVFDFFESVELLVGNLEGILTLQPAFVMAQRHNKEIMAQLSMLKEPEEWLLCLSNNHSGDFGFADFCFHLDRLHWAGFNVMGRKDVPSFLYENKLHFVSGAMWSNQSRASFLTRFTEVDDYFVDDPKVFNILYPHWHYEYELYPRPKIIEDCNLLIKGWDLIIGHHPHVVQPITRIEVDNVQKVIAYSLGNFCSGLDRKAHEYGMIVKCEIGPLISNDKQLAVGQLEWQFVRIEKEQKIKFKKNMLKLQNPPFKNVKIVQKNRFFKNI